MLQDEIRTFFRGEIADDEAARATYSRDASVFEVRPELIAFPKDSEDVGRLVRFVAEKKPSLPALSLTPRSAGTDMSGGPLGESIIVDFAKHFTRIHEVSDGYAITEPGVFYRDFEKETLRRGYFLPSYPASRELCTVGGMVANNAGGEKNLKYGKTEKYVERLKVVMSDGEEYAVHPLTRDELEEKMRLESFEGNIYRRLYALLEEHYDVIQKARPNVSKNSAGYYLWNVWNRERFDLAQLFTGSQGTLGMITEITFRLAQKPAYSGMLVVYLKDMTHVGELVNAVLPTGPSAFEAFDDETLKLAFRFLPNFLQLLGAKNLFSLGIQFIPDLVIIALHGMPKLTLLIEFEEASQSAVREKLERLAQRLARFRVQMRTARTRAEANKYWAIRRESFNLLRHKIKDRQTAPFIDDFVVNPQTLPEFFPKLHEILDRYALYSTIAGHAGDGNFHIIPLMDLSKEAERAKIPKVAEEVYRLVLSYKGSITAEHNDGLIRSPYLGAMYGEAVCALFEKVKNIFDPLNIFNPGKKVGSSLAYAFAHLKRG